MIEAKYIGDNPDLAGEYGFFERLDLIGGADGYFYLEPDGKKQQVYLDELSFLDPDEASQLLHEGEEEAEAEWDNDQWNPDGWPVDEWGDYEDDPYEADWDEQDETEVWDI